MKFHCNHKILLISVLAIGLIYYFFTNTSKLHEPISASDVESINIWGSTNRVASSSEQQDIIKWFNSITNIRENKNFEGTTPDAGIILT